MSAGHFRRECSCGAVLEQCRCPDPAKRVEVVPHGCAECRAKWGPPPPGAAAQLPPRRPL